MTTSDTLGHARTLDPGSVTRDNWAEPPQNRWSFLHLDDVLDTRPVERGSAAAPLASEPRPLLDVVTPRYDVTNRIIEHSPAGAVFESTYTDAVIVLHRGAVVCEEYYGEMTEASRHLVMSVTKTLVGLLVAALAEERRLRLDDRVGRIIPELSPSGFGDATIRHLLDMRSGVRFSETYHDPDADVYLMEHAVGWRSPRPDVPDTMHAYLPTLPKDKEHWSRFRYNSSETNVLGWACERSSGQDLATLLHERIWSPMGAEHDAFITVDKAGAAVADGGLNASVRDVARFGELLRCNGTTHDGVQVAPPWFVTDTLLGAEDSKDAFAATESPTGMPGGHYRNQIWVPFRNRSVMLALGIHGQMVYVNQRAGITAVKLSTWPTAQDAVAFYDTLGAFESIARALAPETVPAPTPSPERVSDRQP